MLNQTCPLPESLPDILAVSCSQQFGQIQKLGIRMIQNSGDTGFDTLAEILGKAAWEAMLTAGNGTKLVITPNLPGLVIPNSEELKEEGGNNNTINGISIPVGKGTVKVTCKPLNLPVKVAKSIEALAPFSNVSGETLIEAFFFNEAGQIIYKADSDAGANGRGFPIYNLFVSSVGSEGFNKANTHVISFEMPGDWDEGLLIASPMKSGTPAPWDPRKLTVLAP